MNPIFGVIAFILMGIDSYIVMPWQEGSHLERLGLATSVIGALAILAGIGYLICWLSCHLRWV